jgi:hemerythrin-like domain-containing protein
MSDPKSAAIGTIRSEHRSLAAVINNMKAVLHEVRTGRMAMNYPLFWSMVHYIDVFPNRFHHPKEDDWLFAKLKLRTQEADTLIDTLQSQHQGEAAVLGELRRWLGNTEAGVADSFDGFETAVNNYANFTWTHLRCEEHDLLPLAEKHLRAEDWQAIAAAFAENADPLCGHAAGSQEFNDLFRAIVRATPAPLGLG